MDTDPKKVIKLVEGMTRAEIMARHGPLGNGGMDWFAIFIKKKDELQQYLFGSSDFVKLGIQWGILQKENKSKNKKQIISNEIDDMIGEL